MRENKFGGLQIAEKCRKEHFQSPCAVSGIQNNFNPTRNSESARRNAPDSVHGGEIRDIKCKTGQPNAYGLGWPAGDEIAHVSADERDGPFPATGTADSRAGKGVGVDRLHTAGDMQFRKVPGSSYFLNLNWANFVPCGQLKFTLKSMSEMKVILYFEVMNVIPGGPKKKRSEL